MTKSELRNRMVVETRKGNRYLVVDNISVNTAVFVLKVIRYIVVPKIKN